MVSISCVFPPAVDTPDHVALAERLGYGRAWMYDSPALYLDVWSTLARSADRTEHIGLGTAVVVPQLRHVMATAAAVATIEAIAPGRLTVGIGTGFTGSRALGQQPMRWTDLEAYIAALRALLRGEQVEWEGATIEMIHPPGYAPIRPIDVPVYLAAEGPRGVEVARRLADGLFRVMLFPPEGFTSVARLTYGTVLEEGESPMSDRVLAAAGPGAVVTYHALFETNRTLLDQMPNGPAWGQAADAVPANVRHLAVHDRHLVGVNELDGACVPREVVAALTLTGDPAHVRAGVAQMAAGGITEIVYQPTGDVERELKAFASAISLSPGAMGKIDVPEAVTASPTPA